MTKVARKLVWFRRDNDELAGELSLRGISLRDLRRAFDVSDDDADMVLSYEVITPVQRELIERHTGQSLHFTRYAYFIECDAPAAAAATRHKERVA